VYSLTEREISKISVFETHSNLKTNKNNMKKVFFFVALAIGLSSCTDSQPIKTLTIQRMDGRVQQVKSTVSMNVKGDSIMVCDVYCSGVGTSTTFYGNLGYETPEDYFNADSVGVYSKNYEPAVVLKVEVE
jgi:hypothetical protein